MAVLYTEFDMPYRSTHWKSIAKVPSEPDRVSAFMEAPFPIATKFIGVPGIVSKLNSVPTGMSADLYVTRQFKVLSDGV